MANRLHQEERLLPGEEIVSLEGRFRLTMQADGNLVLYRNSPFEALWASATAGKQVAFAIMQGDGNFVVYAPDGTPLWHAGTHGNPGTFLQIQDDGNLVLYAPGDRAIWASGTVQPEVLDNPILRNLLAQKIKQSLADHSSEATAWYNEGSDTEPIDLGPISVGSITVETKTWVWLDNPADNLSIDVYMLTLTGGGELRFGIRAQGKAKVKAWGKVPRVITADVNGSCRTEIVIEGSTRIAANRLTDASIFILDGTVSDVRFSNDALKAIQGLIRDVMNRYIDANERAVKQDIVDAINGQSF
jgi:hypothetical protein